jgi:ribosomal protein S3
MTSNSNSVISKKLNNIENECRKIQLIEYLKQSVKKHRSDNIYLYLSTIAEARKDLRKLKQFTKKHASFLFGTINSEGQNLCPEEQKTKIQERVRLVLDNSHSKADLEKTLQDIFLEQIEKQRNMYIDNVQLTPKIAIKFYSVKEKSVKAKASIVADSVVDALEQRSSFRKIIKKAKEDLMRSPISSSDGKINRVKGVKIQVSGRLNGAEIARSEWVRAGRVPLQTLRANLDYSYKTANTIYGIIGVKVWIFKGYTTLL